MGVKVDGNLYRSLEAFDQIIGFKGREKPGHVLYTDRVGPQVLELFGLLDEVVQTVDGTHGVANRGFDMLAALFDHLHGGFDVPDIVQRVEDPKHIDAMFGGSLNKFFQDVVGVMTVADDVLSADKHLKAGIRHRGAKGSESFPGVFLKKPQTGVKGCSTPDFKRPKPYFVQFCRDWQ